MTTTTAPRTLVDDGQLRWLADTAELVREMRRLGWHVDEMGPGDLIREPMLSDAEFEDEVEPWESYATLCAAVPAVEDDVHTDMTPPDDAEELSYVPSRQGWEASPAILDALRAAS